MINEKPIIGIVGRCPLENVRDEIIEFGENYRRAVIRSGGVPLGIMPPNDLVYKDAKPSEVPSLTDDEKDILIRQLKLCNGIIMPGGYKRFAYDLFILNYALKNDIPLLGICLGMQIMTMLDEYGNSVLHLEHIDDENSHLKPDEEYVHEIKIDKASKLYKIIGKDKIMVNSKHRSKVVETATFDIYGKSNDGIIELIERHDKKFMIGVQWHPEKLFLQSDDSSIKLFDAFIKVCRGGTYES